MIEDMQITVGQCGAVMGESIATLVLYGSIGYLCVRGIIELAGYLYKKKGKNRYGNRPMAF